MKTIWKWNLKVDDEVTIEAPRGAVFVETVRATSLESFEVWAEVDTEQPLERRRLVVVGTGNPKPTDLSLRRLGAAFGGPFVWHVYEVRP